MYLAPLRTLGWSLVVSRTIDPGGLDNLRDPVSIRLAAVAVIIKVVATSVELASGRSDCARRSFGHR